MRKFLGFTTVIGLALGLLPAASGTAGASPVGGDTNPLGSLYWLPDNANEKGSVPANRYRLVVAYDRSLNAAGQPTPLLGKGPFGVKFTAASDITMTNHSTRVTDLKSVTGRPEADVLDQNAMGVAGDVRDGACSKVTEPTFSQAYSTTRSFFFPGQTPYAPVSAPGTCETVDSSVEVRDANDVVVGFQTTVTNHVPGFWIEVNWPEHALTVPVLNQPLFGGRQQAEVFYGSFFDTGGDNGNWYQVADTTGTSTSVGSPGQYDYTFTLTANPGAGSNPLGSDPCNSLGAPSQAGTWADVKVQVPQGTTKAVFKLFFHGDWDLRVIDPLGRIGDNGFFVGSEETETVPTAGSGNIPTLEPGEFTIRGCNPSGEPTIRGAVILTPHLNG